MFFASQVQYDKGEQYDCGNTHIFGAKINQGTDEHYGDKSENTNDFRHVFLTDFHISNYSNFFDFVKGELLGK